MIYTIGHSNHSLEAFLGLLTQHGITALADVRSVPYSRRHPDYNREVLQDWLKAHGIAYVFLGDQLGGRSRDPGDFAGERIDYGRLRAKEGFRAGIERLLQGREQCRIVLLCAEKDPLNCHRGLLIAPELEKRNVPVGHILADGCLERHRPDTETRLLKALGFSAEGDLFSSREELLEKAYWQQAQEFAYRLK
ncbi:MAG: DUF488 family protein [Methylohalobius sp.]